MVNGWQEMREKNIDFVARFMDIETCEILDADVDVQGRKVYFEYQGKQCLRKLYYHFTGDYILFQGSKWKVIDIRQWVKMLNLYNG